jgi:NAD(P)H-hydrate epimerase
MLCGSRGMLGSATLACSAALRSGCGMVHAVVPAGSIDTLSVKLTETVLHAVAETAAGSLASAAAATVRELAGRAQSLCIGPGLSTQEETARLVRALVSELSLPCVLDADGLNAYRGHAADFKGHAGPLVITPHAGEWQRLFGPLPTEPLAMIASLRKTAVDHTMTILYKGNPSLVAAADGRCFVLPVGNSGMATAGAGDVLSGIIAGLLAQGAEPTDAALLGAWLHGAAGDAAATARTEYCLIASDIVEHLPHAFRRLLAPAG